MAHRVRPNPPTHLHHSTHPPTHPPTPTNKHRQIKALEALVAAHKKEIFEAIHLDLRKPMAEADMTEVQYTRPFPTHPPTHLSLASSSPFQPPSSPLSTYLNPPPSVHLSACKEKTLSSTHPPTHPQLAVTEAEIRDTLLNLHKWMEPEEVPTPAWLVPAKW